MSMHRKGKEMMLQRNTKLDALDCVPHLIASAHAGKKLTYGELANKISNHHRPALFWLGFIRDKLCVPNGYPMITAIVVNQDTGLPGDSFLPGGTSHLSPSQYRDEAKRVQKQVFDFQDWDGLAELALQMRSQI